MSSPKVVMFDFINGRQGDPAVLYRPSTMGNSILFDLGRIDSLSNRELLKVNLVLVSHTHIDHFIGFDRLLRVNIPHSRIVTLVGPSGFIERVSAKINGYSWNLLVENQLKFQVFEISEEIVRKAQFSNNSYTIVDEQSINSLNALAEIPWNEGTKIVARSLDHGISSLGYRFELPIRYRVNIDAIRKNGIDEGPWIKNLQNAVRREDWELQIDTGTCFETVAELNEKYLDQKPLVAIGYITDFVFSEKNVEALKELLAGASELICECSFRDDHRTRAYAKKHLTTRQAALIAARCGVKNFEAFHVSHIYGEEFDEIVAEANRFFSEFVALDNTSIDALITQELEILKTSG